MNDALITHHLDTALTLVLWLSLPPLLIASGIGLLVGLIQAVTQIQDQTLPQSIKLIAVLISLILFGPILAQPLIQHTDQLFNDFPTITR
jgi:type III secretion protein S